MTRDLRKWNKVMTVMIGIVAKEHCSYCMSESVFTMDKMIPFT